MEPGTETEQESSDRPGDSSGKRFPNADEIEIPEGVAMVPVEPGDAGPDDPGGELRPRLGILDTIADCAARVRLVFDGLLLVVTFVVPLFILGFQSVQWLGTQTWPSVPVERFIAWLQLDPAVLGATPWPGLNEAIAWLFAIPVVPVLFVTGLSLHILSGLLFPRIRRD